MQNGQTGSSRIVSLARQQTLMKLPAVSADFFSPFSQQRDGLGQCQLCHIAINLPGLLLIFLVASIY